MNKRTRTLRSSLLCLVLGASAATLRAEVDSFAADLHVTKSVAPLSVAPGDPATFHLGIENLGPDTAQNAVVTDTLPAGIEYVGNSCGATWAPPTLTWNVGNMPEGAIAFCEIEVTVTSGAVNTATAASDYFDPVPGNSAASAAVSLLGVVEVPALDVAGLALLGLGLGGVALSRLRRR